MLCTSLTSPANSSSAELRLCRGTGATYKQRMPAPYWTLPSLPRSLRSPAENPPADSSQPTPWASHFGGGTRGRYQQALLALCKGTASLAGTAPRNPDKTHSPTAHLFQYVRMTCSSCYKMGSVSELNAHGCTQDVHVGAVPPAFPMAL